MPNVNPIDNKTNYTNVSNETVNSSNNVPSYVLNNSTNTGDTFTKEGDKKESPGFLGSLWQSIASIPQSIANLPIWKPKNPVEWSTEEKLETAQNSNDINTLSQLMNDPDPKVRAAVADNFRPVFWDGPEYTKERINMSRKLADDPDSSVKIALINNQEKDFVPDDVRIKLSSDPDPAVRAEIAKTYSLPENIYQKLSNDTDPAVRLAIAKNRGTPDAVIKDIETRNNEDPEIKQAALRLPTLTNEECSSLKIPQEKIDKMNILGEVPDGIIIIDIMSMYGPMLTSSAYMKLDSTHQIPNGYELKIDPSSGTTVLARKGEEASEAKSRATIKNLKRRGWDD